MAAITEQSKYNEATQIEKNKIISLFRFIQELNKLKQQSILNYKDYPWIVEITNLPDDINNIKTYYKDRFEEENTEPATDNSDILLSVHKPEFQKCPQPDKIFIDWLYPDWDDYRKPVLKRDTISSEEKDIPA